MEKSVGELLSPYELMLDNITETCKPAQRLGVSEYKLGLATQMREMDWNYELLQDINPRNTSTENTSSNTPFFTSHRKAIKLLQPLLYFELPQLRNI
jgi:hypothetical protein